MRIVVAWLRIGLRCRSRTLPVLVLLVAISAETVLTAVAGVCRDAAPYDRLLDQPIPRPSTPRGAPSRWKAN